jgi:branched-chain amino acid transport system permease protein
LLVALAVFFAVNWAQGTERITTYWYQVIQIAGITAISALGLNLIYGFNGQFSLGHIGFYAIGAYGAALITKDFMTQWSGSAVGALAWMIAGQVGVVMAMLAVKWLRVASIRDRVSASLSTLLKSYESAVIITLLMLVFAALAIAVGVAVTWLLHEVLLAALVGLTMLPPKTGETVIFVLALINGGTMAALVAYLVGLPLLRLGSDYFGIATLGFAIMMYTALQNSDTVIATMKGARGMVGIPKWSTWGWVFGALVVSVVIMRNLIYSSHGRALVSVREDEIAARTMGIDVVQLKTLSFAFGAFFAGIAGGLYAHLFAFLHPSSFNLIRGFDPMIIIVFGGLGSMTGTIVASAVFALVIEGLRVVLPQGFEDWRFVIYPIILLLIMLLRPQGLLGTSEWGWLRSPLPPARDVPVPDRVTPQPQRARQGEDA